MLALLNSYSSGSAVGILLNPPKSAVKWRVLRNLTGIFTDQDSSGLIYEGDEKHITDIAGLDNGIAVFYQPFYWDGFSWSTTASKRIVPGITLINRSVDVLGIVRDRLDAGMNGLVVRGDLYHSGSVIPVMTASPQIEDAVFPIVTIHLMSDNSDSRFLGDVFTSDVENSDGSISEVDGWYSQVSLEIVIWSLNGDERKTLRSAMKAILLSNLTIFSSFEIEEIDLQFSDQEDFQSYQSPMYMAHCTMRCVAPSAIIAGNYPVILTTSTTILGL